MDALVANRARVDPIMFGARVLTIDGAEDSDGQLPPDGSHNTFGAAMAIALSHSGRAVIRHFWIGG